MKVNTAFEFDDRALRQIAQEGCGQRSGKASRKTVRYWLNKLVTSTLQSMHEPKMRRRRVTEDQESKAAQVAMQDYAAEADAVCACGKQKQEHFGARFNCPLSKSVKPGQRFKAVQHG